MPKAKMSNKKRKCLSYSTFLVFFVITTCFFLVLFSYTDGQSDFLQKQKHQRFYSNSPVEYTYKCQDRKCVKTLVHSDINKTSLETCGRLCRGPPIWPKPTKFSQIDNHIYVLNSEKISFEIPCHSSQNAMLKTASKIFLERIKKLGNNNQKSDVVLKIQIILEECSSVLELETDESYKLLLKQDQEASQVFVYISAKNFYGARHGLETLLQLIWYDPNDGALKIIADASIEDSPKFKHRGLMIDTARNFYSLPYLLRAVNAMSMAKLNVLHLHLTDAASFPLVLPQTPQLSEFGAYTPKMVYTPEDIKQLREYALIRGIRLLLEIDAPSHVHVGWNLFEENLVICSETDALNGHLNPDNELVLDVLQDIYSDLLSLSGQNKIFHIGGDEVDLNCWRNTQAVKSKNLQSKDDLTKFWAGYTNEMMKRLKIANQNVPLNVIMWSSPLTSSNYLKMIEGNITIQSWLGSPKKALEDGHTVIYSTVGHWYLDCGFGPWKTSVQNGNCDPYTPWQKFYRYRPWKEYGYQANALGGEACLWSEQVNEDTLETRLWPRTAAFAERVWSDPEELDMYDVTTRLMFFQDRLRIQGVKSEQIWPRWCTDNPGNC